MESIREMQKLGIVSHDTYEHLSNIFTDRFDLLVADGGAGAIHGDPVDALNSDSDRVVFVHVEHLAHQFTTAFHWPVSASAILSLMVMIQFIHR